MNNWRQLVKMFCLFLGLVVAIPAYSQEMDITFNKTTPGVGVADTKTFPSAVQDPGDYICFIYTISSQGIESKPSNPSAMTKIGTGPFDVTFGWTWPAKYEPPDGDILPGDLIVARATCELSTPPPSQNPIPEAVLDLEVQ